MSEHDNAALDAMLKEVFGGTTIPSPKVIRDAPKGDESVETLPPGFVLISEEELSAAIKRGPTGLIELVMEKAKEEAAKFGHTMAEIKTIDSGIIISKGDATIELPAGEVVYLHRMMGMIIEAKMREQKQKFIQDVIRKIWSEDPPEAGE